MMESTMRELQEELTYWTDLEARAKAQGQTGETFARCRTSIREEIRARRLACAGGGCEVCAPRL